ncbi:MAG: Nif3-like dinuclear metal center hexameric protein [Firmicutes bacterium]|nr:Nif3-like dinuclear metal center hexameric protein [Bacillota bacterium]
MEELAPSAFALEGDPTGLQWGDPDQEVKGILLALDFNKDVLQEALDSGCNMVISHHPYLFRPLSSLDLRRQETNLLYRALQHGIILLSAHTNLDVAPLGVNYVLADLLQLEERELLRVTGREKLLKLVVYVPVGHEDKVRDALGKAGAGWVGNYSHCTFQTRGTGTFLPGEGAEPFLGEKGDLNKVDEYRLETILPARLKNKVLKSMLKVHPYEEVAYDLYQLQNEGKPYGLGWVGTLPRKMTLSELAQIVKSRLAARQLRVLGEGERKVERVAVVGGSGGEFITDALRCRAEVLITGDIKYHDAQLAERRGLFLIDAGHDYTERPAMSFWARLLDKELRQRGYSVGVKSADAPAWSWSIF